MATRPASFWVTVGMLHPAVMTAKRAALRNPFIFVPRSGQISPRCHLSGTVQALGPAIAGQKHAKRGQDSIARQPAGGNNAALHGAPGDRGRLRGWRRSIRQGGAELAAPLSSPLKGDSDSAALTRIANKRKPYVGRIAPIRRNEPPENNKPPIKAGRVRKSRGRSAMSQS